jgi:hypothetical protein
VTSRVVRDGFWTSENVSLLHDKTALLYLRLIHLADDFGLVEISYGNIKPPLKDWKPEEVAKMLDELVSHGLILAYSSEQCPGKQFAAISKWQSRISSVKPKYPVPSFGLGHVMVPHGYRDTKTRLAVANLLGHLSIDNRGDTVVPQYSNSGTNVHEGLGVRGKGVKINTCSSSTNAPPGFAEFWKTYPHYGNRSSTTACLKLWHDLQLEPIAEKVISGVREHKKSPDWTKKKGEYVKGAQVWLRGRCWEDVVSVPEPDPDSLDYLLKDAI